MTVWNDEMDAALMAFWREGHSANEIGRRIGKTKNSIIGRSHRIDLPRRETPIIRAGGPTKPVQPPRVTGPTLPALPSEQAAEEPPEMILAPAPPTPDVIPPQPCKFQRGTDEWGALFDKMWLDGATGAEMERVLGLTSHGQLTQIRMTRGLPARWVQSRSAAAVDAARKASAAPVPAKLEPSEVRYPDSVSSMRVSPMPKPQPIAPRNFGRVVSCLWPVGTPGTRGFRFCDVPSEPGRPYCEDHVKIAYVHIRDRREDAA